MSGSVLQTVTQVTPVGVLCSVPNLTVQLHIFGSHFLEPGLPFDGHAEPRYIPVTSSHLSPSLLFASCAVLLCFPNIPEHCHILYVGVTQALLEISSSSLGI